MAMVLFTIVLSITISTFESNQRDEVTVIVWMLWILKHESTSYTYESWHRSVRSYCLRPQERTHITMKSLLLFASFFLGYSLIQNLSHQHTISCLLPLPSQGRWRQRQWWRWVEIWRRWRIWRRRPPYLHILVDYSIGDDDEEHKNMTKQGAAAVAGIVIASSPLIAIFVWYYCWRQRRMRKEGQWRGRWVNQHGSSIRGLCKLWTEINNGHLESDARAVRCHNIWYSKFEVQVQKTL